jgi:putative peptidoglycan binding protein
VLNIWLRSLAKAAKAKRGTIMKRVLYSVCIGGLALALTAEAQQIDDRWAERARPQQRTATVQAARPGYTGAVRNPRSYNSAARYRPRSYSAPRSGSNEVFNQNSPIQTLREQNFARNQQFRAQRDAAFNRQRNFALNRDRDLGLNRTEEINRERNLAVNRTRNFEVNRYRNTNEFRGQRPTFVPSGTVRNRNFAMNGAQNFGYYHPGNSRIINQWHSDAFRGQQYAAFHNYEREWHDRGWWRSHYDRIIFVNGGWYYWDAGYWFPAWGYDPYFSYVYDGPIYAYDGLPPDQVTVDVQEQLASAGYYDGPIDGVLGPMTREAIANFQADNGLAVTSAIDEPTLATMGLV